MMNLINNGDNKGFVEIMEDGSFNITLRTDSNNPFESQEQAVELLLQFLNSQIEE